jgi:hypothetical protein
LHDTDRQLPDCVKVLYKDTKRRRRRETWALGERNLETVDNTATYTTMIDALDLFKKECSHLLVFVFPSGFHQQGEACREEKGDRQTFFD